MILNESIIKVVDQRTSIQQNINFDDNKIPLPKVSRASNYDLWLILKNKSKLYKYEYTYLR
jgi:hypothetical protein